MFRTAADLLMCIGSSLVATLLLVLLFAHPGRDDPTAAIRFRDVAAKAGLGFVLENDPTPRKHLVETMAGGLAAFDYDRSEEHTSELQSRLHLVCRLLLEKKKKKKTELKKGIVHKNN